MTSTKVELCILDLNSVIDADIPNDMTVSEMIGDITAQMALPLIDQFGAVVAYKIDSKALGCSLFADETLTSAGVPSGDRLTFRRDEFAGGGTKTAEHRIKFDKSSIGLSLDDLTAVDIRALLANEPALMMTLHSYRASLIQLEELTQALKDAEEEIRYLHDRLKEKNIATGLLLLGQIQVGFGTNLVTNGSTGGWFVFLAGLGINIGALFFSLFGLKRRRQ